MFIEMKTLEEQLIERVDYIYNLAQVRTTTCSTFLLEVMRGVWLFLRYCHPPT
jgi:hypothetical protein